MLVVGLAVDVGLWLLPEWELLAIRIPAMLVAVVLNAAATVLYIGAGMGPGPRDGLMTGLVRRTGWSVRVVRTSLEVVVLGTGWLLGGGVGLGTVVYAVAIGPLVQLFIPFANRWLPGFTMEVGSGRAEDEPVSGRA